MKKYLFLCITLLFVPFFVFGQETATDDATMSQEGIEADFAEEVTPEIVDEIMSEWGYASAANTDVDCSDYYHFAEVQVDIWTQRQAYNIGGDGVSFIGDIVNVTDQPIVDGVVFMRVGRVNDNRADYNYIVDEKIVVDKITLKPGESKSIEFNWDIPYDVSGGKYQADFFLSVGKKFNLVGLPFTNEIIAGSTVFDINTENERTISFDRAQTKVNNIKYNHIGSWPFIAQGEEATLTQVIDNFSENDINVNIIYDLYYWDSLDESDLIKTSSEVINIPARGNKEISYIFPPMDTSVYYLKITALSGDMKSIVNVRTTSAKDSPRINYPAITKFPLSKGDEVTLFTCFHNTSSVGANGAIEVTLFDGDTVIAHAEYDGTIPPTMSAIKEDLVVKKDYDILMLTAQLKDKNGNVVDEYSVEYDCKDFDSCQEQQHINNTINNSGFLVAKNIMYILAGLVFIGVIIVIIFKRKK